MQRLDNIMQSGREQLLVVGVARGQLGEQTDRALF